MLADVDTVPGRDNGEMTDVLPDATRAQVQAMPKFRMGVHRIGVRPVSGIKVDDVLISGGRVTGLLGQEHPRIDATEAMEVEDQRGRPLPPDLSWLTRTFMPLTQT